MVGGVSRWWVPSLMREGWGKVLKARCSFYGGSPVTVYTVVGVNPWAASLQDLTSTQLKRVQLLRGFSGHCLYSGRGQPLGCIPSSSGARSHHMHARTCPSHVAAQLLFSSRPRSVQTTLQSCALDTRPCCPRCFRCLALDTRPEHDVLQPGRWPWSAPWQHARRALGDKGGGSTRHYPVADQCQR